MKSKSPPAHVVATLDDLAERAADGGYDVAVIGALARIARGSFENTAGVDVAASLNIDVDDGEPHPLGGSSFHVDGVPVQWITRFDELAPLYLAAIERAETLPGWPLPVVRIDDHAAMLLATRRGKDRERLGRLLVSGLLDPEAARARVLELLGPYAIADIERITQDAEWLAMRLRYTDDGEVH